MRRRRYVAVTAITIGVGLLAGACSSSGKSTGTDNAATATTSASQAAGAPIKIGVLTDSTGVAASGFQTTEIGIKAYANSVNAAGGVNGQKITYVMADSQSTPAGALTAVQKLVQTDKVFAMINVSSDFYGAETYALKQGLPVIGGSFDGPEWSDPKNTNLFAAQGVSDVNAVYSNLGQYFKAQGVTSCGSVGYASSPSAQKAATGALKSCEAQGLKGGYVSQVTFGSTDVGPIALAMKAAGVDGVYMPVVPNTGFALAGALRQVGVQPKSFLLATGYGSDLLASSAAVTAAQGFDFSSSLEPVEMNTPATQVMVKNLAAVGFTQTPTFAIQTAYAAMAGFVHGLKVAGANPTQASYMKALRGVTDFDVDGLMDPIKVNFSNYSPDETCSWIVKLQGKKFVPQPKIPYCGNKLQGVKP
ncbi:MAG: transporter substrate-binding protein [Frankiales bacterium]|jgi:branched-chain amino acid transport system substrate-binding protein|nr:transporter substrate-binding protein [Frankiales bacterium]